VNGDETRVLDAARAMVDRFGFNKVTIDDICASSGVSRATIYRLFPGGREVLFEALRLRELEGFFERLEAEAAGSLDLEELLVRCIVFASRELRSDEQLASMLASERGAVLANLTVDGVPRIVNVATQVITPLAEEFVPRETAVQIVEVLARLVISYFLAPSTQVDFTNANSVRTFLESFNFLIHPMSTQ
jgi:AcrR family transcriptional regulator